MTKVLERKTGTVEARLRSSEQRLIQAQRLANLGIWELDLRKRALLWSDEHFRLFGLTPTADGIVDGAALDELPREALFAHKVMEQALRRQTQFSHRYQVRLANGKTRHMHAEGEVLFDAAGRPILMAGITQDITRSKRFEEEREELHKQVLDSRTQLRHLTRRLFQAQEDERRRLAAELHDEIGQVLTAVSLSLELTMADADAAGRERLAQSAAVVDRAIEQVRGMSLDLRPAMLDVMGLEPALRWLIDRQSAVAGLSIEFTSQFGGQRLTPELESASYRIVQEALTNVARHAGARHVNIDLMRKRNRLHVSITDDGAGFDVAAARGWATSGDSFGLLGMEERFVCSAVRLLWIPNQAEGRPSAFVCRSGESSLTGSAS